MNHEQAVQQVGARLRSLAGSGALPPVPLSAVTAPLAALNVGLESFADSLVAQGAAALHVDWRPPAGGNEKLMGILARLKAHN
jgi:FdrA protein